jgi:hypothetical protein
MNLKLTKNEAFILEQALDCYAQEQHREAVRHARENNGSMEIKAAESRRDQANALRARFLP